jgi:tRNA threonylcarbamoyladenosine biosynthesis protein TsaB
VALLLCIETATPVCSVALCDERTILAEETTAEKNAPSALLTSLIERLFSATGKSLHDLAAVAVSRGPGSYTGLRIGVSTAKGLCYGLDKPLISVNTLESMAWGYINRHLKRPDAKLFCPMIDARRYEVFTATFDRDCSEVSATAAVIVEPDTYHGLLNDNIVVFFGDGAAKCRSIISHPNAVFDDTFNITAADMITRAFTKLGNNTFENTAYFEPFYLKDFIAGLPRVKGLD